MEKIGFRVRIKDGDNEIEVHIPMTDRTTIGMNEDGTGLRALEVVEKLVEKIKKLR